MEEGVLQDLVNASQYNILEETLARRTYDESGNYVLDDFRMDVREHRTNNRGTWAVNQTYQVRDFVISSVSSATTRYFECIQAGVSGVAEPTQLSQSGIDESTVITDNSTKWRYVKSPVYNRGKKLTGDSSNLVATIGFGKAYVQGYEINKTSNSDLIIPKARDTRTETKRNIALNQGNYVYFSKQYSYGLPDISTQPIVYFYDRFAQSTLNKFGYGNIVGTGRINWVENDPRGGLKVSLANIKMISGKGFDRDVNRIVVFDSTTSNVTQTSYALTGTIKYAGNGTSSYLQIAGTMGTSSQAAGSNLIVSGNLTAFTQEVLPGDLITFGSAGYATTSSWTVVSVPNQTTLVLSGGALQANATTAMFVRFAANVAFGHASSVAAVSTRFQSECRVGDTVYIANAGTSTTGIVTAIINENRMVVSSVVTSITTGVVFGQYYAGRNASFSADIWSNFPLGINGRKYTGLFTLSDYSGGTTTVQTHQAVRITGTNDSKLLTEM